MSQATEIEQLTVLEKIHWGERLKYWLDHMPQDQKNRTGLAKALGYSGRGGAYSLQDQDSWKVSTLIGVCKYLGLSPEKFLGLEYTIPLFQAQEVQSEYNKPRKFIEERLEDLEGRLEAMESARTKSG